MGIALALVKRRILLKINVKMRRSPRENLWESVGAVHRIAAFLLLKNCGAVRAC
jgi:hypothetical protein